MPRIPWPWTSKFAKFDEFGKCIQRIKKTVFVGQDILTTVRPPSKFARVCLENEGRAVLTITTKSSIGEV